MPSTRAVTKRVSVRSLTSFGKVRLIDPHQLKSNYPILKLRVRIWLCQIICIIFFRTIDQNNIPVGVERVLTDNDQQLGGGIFNLKASLDHLSIQQATIGAQMAKAALQTDVIETRKLAVTTDISKIGDADLATLVTELQQQLTNKEAAQQAFAKIGQQSLFDFIR